MINHTCYKCHRRIELDPVFVGSSLARVKKKNPTHYHAICPSCGAVNKISLKEMQKELNMAAEAIKELAAKTEQSAKDEGKEM